MKCAAKCDKHAVKQNVVNPSGRERALCFRDTLEGLPVLVSILLTPTICVLCVPEQWAPLTRPSPWPATLSSTCAKRPRDHLLQRVGGSQQRFALCHPSEKEHELRSASPLNLSI